MQKQLTDVRNFMLANDQEVRSQPVLALGTEERMLRYILIREELNEFREALGVHEDENGLYTDYPKKPVNPVEVLDALTDILYVTFGAFHTLGLGSVAEAAFAEVQRSNMSKLSPEGRPIKNESGKVLKGPNYTPPNLAKVLADDIPSNPFTD